MRPYLLLLLLLAPTGLWSACAVSDLPQPAIYQVCRADHETSCLNRSMAGESLEVFIAGEGLHPSYEVDLGTSKAPEPSGRFRVWLGDRELDDPELSPYSDAEEQILIARLEGGLPLGLYRARVQTPGGQLAELPEAFLITDPMRLRLDLDKQTLPLGDTALLTATIDNLGPARLTRIQLVLSQDDPAHFIAADMPAGFSVAGYESGSAAIALTANALGEGWLTVKAAAEAAGGLAVGGQDEVRIGALVLDQARLVLSIQTQPTTLQMGQKLALIVNIRNEGQVAVSAARLLAPVLEGSGLIQWQIPASGGSPILPGGNLLLTIDGTATGPGAVEVFARAEAVEAISGRIVTAQAGTPLSIQIDP